MSFRSYNHKIYSVTSNKVTMHNPNENEKEVKDDDTTLSTISSWRGVLTILFDFLCLF